MKVELDDDGFTVDCEILAPLLHVQASEIPALLREGAITSLCEKGADENEGEFRLTFFFRGKRVRLIIGPTGGIAKRSVIDFGDRPLPSAMRRPSSP